jgi:ATP-dependent DNA helicase RecQ
MPLRLRCRELGIPVRWAGKEDIAPWRTRETRRLLDLLEPASEVDAEGLAQMLDGIEAACGTSVWTEYLRRLIGLWREEYRKDVVPGREVVDFLWTLMREDRHLAMAEHGVFLGTIHQAKGLEFDRVMLLDCARQLRPRETAEDRRRLFYVGMTRARRVLAVFCLADRALALGSSTPGLEVAVEEMTARVAETRPDVGRRIEKLALEHMDIGLAGSRSENDPIHAAIAALRVGDRLRVDVSARRMYLVCPRSDRAVAALSAAGRNVWASRTILEICVLAVERRSSEHSEAKYRDRCRVDAWELPIVEVVWR